jgi:hypothetical protein
MVTHAGLSTNAAIAVNTGMDGQIADRVDPIREEEEIQGSEVKSREQPEVKVVHKSKVKPSIKVVVSGIKGHLLSRAPTPINVSVLCEWLKSYPKVRERDLLSAGFSRGFKLEYQGPRHPRESECLPSASRNVNATWKKLNKEISLGRIVGPFNSRPLSTLQCSPIGLIEKQQPGEWRLITHLSFPAGDSINDGIPATLCSVKYTSFDQAVGLVQGQGKGALLAKCDIKSAFRLLPIYPGDFDLLGFKFQGKYFIDKCLPMGASISCALFESFSSYLEYQIKVIAKSEAICHYLDDFLFVGPGKSLACQELLKAFQAMCDKLGVPLAPEKTVGPVPKLTFLGLEIDSESQLVKVPQGKVVALRKALEVALASECMTLRDVQSLLGSLNFVCRAISPGRAFLRRLIDLTVGVTKGKAQICVGVGAKKDIEMWIQFLSEFNGSAMFMEADWLSNSSIELFTDAAQTQGFGCYFKGHWTQGHWPVSLEVGQASIALLEMYPLVVALDLWGHLMRNKKVKFWSDNQAVVSIVNKQSAKCPRIMALVRKFVLLALRHNILFKACYIEGRLNGIADALSRFQVRRFQELAPEADELMTPLPAWTR